jgi:hypothetical protein
MDSNKKGTNLMALHLRIAALFVLALALAHCTVTATFDFARPLPAAVPTAPEATREALARTTAEATPAEASSPTPAPVGDVGGPAEGQSVRAVGVYDTAADQLIPEGRWYLADRIRYWTGQMQSTASFPGSELGRLRPKLILARAVAEGEAIKPPHNKGPDIPAWTAFVASGAGSECQPAPGAAWRETTVDVGNASFAAMAEVADWPVSEICPLPNNELSMLVDEPDQPLGSLWVDFMVAATGANGGEETETILYRFVPPKPGEDPGGEESSSVFCEWIDCSGWAGGAACRVLKCE